MAAAGGADVQHADRVEAPGPARRTAASPPQTSAVSVFQYGRPIAAARPQDDLAAVHEHDTLGGISFRPYIASSLEVELISAVPYRRICRALLEERRDRNRRAGPNPVHRVCARRSPRPRSPDSPGFLATTAAPIFKIAPISAPPLISRVQEGQLLMTQADRDRLVTLKKAKKRLITQREAAGELGISTRQVKRLLYALKKRGDKAVVH